MTAPMSPTEIASALRRAGVSETAIDRVTVGGTLVSLEHTGATTAILTTAPSVVLPVYLVLPWSALCSDNYHQKASVKMVLGRAQPFKVLDGRYKSARDKTRELARAVVGDALPAYQPLRLTARVLVPNNSPHDVANFAKCCHDALQGIVYRNDTWLHDVRWIRAGVDVDRPRAEIEVSPL